jgi:hypothetical protein
LIDLFLICIISSIQEPRWCSTAASRPWAVNPEEPTRAAAAEAEAVTRESSRRGERENQQRPSQDDEEDEDEGVKHGTVVAARKTGVQKQGLDALTRAA